MTGRKDIYQNAMSKGHSAAWDQMWDHAAQFYQQALEEFPEDGQALLSYGLSLYELQDHEKALEVYMRAAQQNPEDPIPVEKVSQLYERLGNQQRAAEAAMSAAALFLKKGDANKAVENWSRVTRINPEHMTARSRLALVHERLGRKNQAVTEYLALASLLQDAGKRQEALQAVQHALELIPAHNEARQALTMLEAHQALPKPSRPPLPELAPPPEVPQLGAPKPPEDEFAGLDPIAAARKKALGELASTLFELSEEREPQAPSRRGLRELTQGLSISSDSKERAKLLYHLRQAVDYQTQERVEQAVEEFKAVADMGLDLPAVRFCLGLDYNLLEDLDESARQLQRAVNHIEFAMGARLLLGEVFRKKGRLKEAAVEYLEALKVADSLVVPPERADRLRQLYEPLIEAHVQEADDEAHDKLCQNVYELLVHPDWRSQLAEARRELPMADPDAPPLPLAEIITQASSSQIVSALATIHQHARSSHLRLAMEEAFRALDYAPTYLPLHALMGDLLIQQGHVEAAIAKFVTVATAYSARGEAMRAIDLFRRTVQLAPMDLDGRQRLISHLLLSGDIEATLREYMELADVHLRLAELDRARQTFVKALGLAEQGQGKPAWRSMLLHQIADLDMQRLDWRQALESYEKLRRFTPDDRKARLHLIDLNLRMGQDAQAFAELKDYLTQLQMQDQEDQIPEVLEYLVEHHPDDISLRRQLAQHFQRAGRLEDAVRQWDKVGDNALDAGDQASAIQAIEAIIALNPPNVAEYQRILMDLKGG